MMMIAVSVLLFVCFLAFKILFAGNINYTFPAMLPLEQETHGGDDVAIFADGPWAHLFTGVVEQNVIPHLIAFASCVGNGTTVCDQELGRKESVEYNIDNICLF